MDYSYIVLAGAVVFTAVLGALCKDDLKGARIHQLSTALTLLIVIRLCLIILMRLE